MNDRRDSSVQPIGNAFSQFCIAIVGVSLKMRNLKLAICNMHAVVDRVAYSRAKAWPTGMHHPPVEDYCVPLERTSVATKRVKFS